MSNRLPAILGLMLAFALHAGAQVEVSLPLEGYYRPGKYIPVRIRAPDGGMGIRISGEGAVPTQVDGQSGAIDVVAPILAVDGELRQLNWRTDADGQSGSVAQSLKALRSDERLVGFERVDLELARAVFPGASIIAVGPPAGGNVVSWEAMDLIVLDRSVSDIEANLWCGTSIAVRSAVRPDDRWAWKQIGEYWVVKPEIRGPAASGLNPAVFAPVQAWHGGWPVALRKRLLLIAVLISIWMLAAMLAPAKWRARLAVGVSVAGTAIFMLWWSTVYRIQEKSALVFNEGPVACMDHWTYLTSRTPKAGGYEWRGLVHPFWINPIDHERLGLALHCNSAGDPRAFRYRLVPEVKLAFMDRGEGIPVGASVTISGDLNRLLQRVYLGQGDRAEGVSDEAYRQMLRGSESLGAARTLTTP